MVFWTSTGLAVTVPKARTCPHALHKAWPPALATQLSSASPLRAHASHFLGIAHICRSAIQGTSLETSGGWCAFWGKGAW